MPETPLVISGLTKSFGALKAVDNVSLDVRDREIHAIIGPNGAGKSSLVNLISGLIVPDAGAVAFFGRDITRLPAPDRARLGLNRTFQISNLIANRSVVENVMLAVQSHAGSSFRFIRPFATDKRLRETALHHLGRVGLAERSGVVVAALSHGERRQLELAVALAMAPKVLLLDEPMAGLGPEDSAQVIELLATLREELGILLIEHDMDAVFALADRISVLVYGAVLTTDTPDEVRRSPAVREAYLGEEA
ncbi:MAG: ABC transporter ATP-binding protein [Alphaproteobacteria bacterium]|nr:ABC transporter ATP-binding protein [Alphaproteobacteria bacterium]